MTKELQVVAVIPARAGSRGIPGKNTLLLAGQPILHYTLEAIAESQLVTHLIAITNDPQFRSQAEEAGLLVLDEPEEMAGDTVPIARPIQFAVESYEHQLGLRFDIAIQCEVSTPVRPPRIIDRCLDLLIASHSEVVTTVESAAIHPPQWAVKRAEDGRIRFVTPNPPLHRQEMEPLFHIGGALAAFRREVLGTPNYFSCDCTAVEYQAGECVYLDEPFDVELAEFVIQRQFDRDLMHSARLKTSLMTRALR